MGFQFKFLGNINFEFSMYWTQACLIGSSSGGSGCVHFRTLWYLQLLCMFSFLL